MKKTNKRAFTIVELVIVIAVIAILAAVLIPTFSSLIKRANMNADKAAVKTMNTYLSADEQINGKQDPSQAKLSVVLDILAKSNMDAENYKALATGYSIVWDSILNRVLYIETKTGTIVYPEEYAPGGSQALLVDDFGDPYYLDSNNVKKTGFRFMLTGSILGDDSWRTQTKTTESDALSYFQQEQSSGNLAYNLDQEKIQSIQTNANTFITLKEAIESGTATEEQQNQYNSFVNDTELGDFYSNYTDYYSDNVDVNIIAAEFKASANPSGMLQLTEGTKGETDYKEYTLAKVSSSAQLTDYSEQIRDSKDYCKGYTLFLSNSINYGDAQWTPLPVYAGNIDGCGKSINNLEMSSAQQRVAVYEGTTKGGAYFYYGLISVFEGDYLGNITLDVNCDKPGCDQADGYIYEAKTGHVTAALVGCVISRKDTTTVIENVTIEGNVHGISRTGGIIGNIGAKDVGTKLNGAAGKVYVRNCINKANVYSDCSQSYAHGTVGGIICGTYRNTDTFELYVQNCENYGNVSGNVAGGILGQTISGSNSSKMSFEDCKNYGTITTTMPLVPALLKSSELNQRNISNYGSLTAAGIANTTTTTSNTGFVFKNCVNNGIIIAENLDNTNKFFDTPSIYLSGIAHNGVFNDCANNGTFEIKVVEGVEKKNIPAATVFKVGSISSAWNTPNIYKKNGAEYTPSKPSVSYATGDQYYKNPAGTGVTLVPAN